MDKDLAKRGLSFSYLHNPSEDEAFDPCRLLDDVCEDGIAGAMLPMRNGLRMAGSDHLVVAVTANGGRCRGALAASDMATEQEPFLFVDAAYVSPEVRASHVLERMLALAMLRIAGDVAVPIVIAACVQTPRYVHGLHTLGQRFTGAKLFPAAQEQVVVDLGMAALARRIARVVRPRLRYEAASGVFHRAAFNDGAFLVGGASGSAAHSPQSDFHRMEETLVVIDLSAIDEAVIIDTARKLYRARLKSGVRQGFARSVGGSSSRPRPPLRDASAF
jgi:hypothetical protein